LEADRAQPAFALGEGASPRPIANRDHPARRSPSDAEAGVKCTDVIFLPALGLLAGKFCPRLQMLAVADRYHVSSPTFPKPLYSNGMEDNASRARPAKSSSPVAAICSLDAHRRRFLRTVRDRFRDLGRAGVVAILLDSVAVASVRLSPRHSVT